MISARIYRQGSFVVMVTLLLVANSEEMYLEYLQNSSASSVILSENAEILSSNQTDKEENVSIITSSSLNGTSSDNSTDYPSDDDCEDLECPIDTRVLLKTDEYNQLEHGRLHAHFHKKYFEKCEYFEHDHGMVVCYSQLVNKEDDRILSIITLIGLSTSAVFIILHLILFLLIAEMRNLPGCCLASLCVALVFAYIHFLIPATVENFSKTSCIGVAMCIYYFFMASFFWMNVIAFDVWRSLRAATTRLRVMENKLPKRRFLFYSLYAWLTPMSLAILTHQIDSSVHIPDKYRPRFADVETGRCWFKETHSLLLLFIIPFVVLICLNILLFGISAYIIVKASFHSSEANREMLVRKFFVFLRLALLMGLTWVFGIIKSFTDSIPLTYLFVIGNSFQGLFIFLAFSWKPTVKKYFRRKGIFSSRTSSRTKMSFRPSTSSSAV